MKIHQLHKQYSTGNDPQWSQHHSTSTIQPTITKCLEASLGSRHTTKFQTLIDLLGPIV